MDFLLDYYTANQIILYFLHFLFSLLDWIIFTSFFIAWELFFISWGYLSFEYNFFIFYFLMSFWAIIWDNISYFIWKKYWRKIFSNWWRFLNEKQLKRWEDLLKKHWVKMIFLSRFIWPFSWIAPSVSGIFDFNYKKFFIFNSLWILLGVLHFMAYGYFFATGFAYFWNTVFVNLLLLVLLFYILFLFLIKLKFFIKNWKYFSIFFLFLKYFFTYILFFLFILFYYYFYLYPKEAVFYDWEVIIKDVKSYIKLVDRKIYSDKIIQTNSNPINIILIIDKDLDSFMESIFWHKNLSFSSWEISPKKFFQLLFEKTPPISDYYHQGFNQNFQYQDISNSAAKRNHIRFWQVWKDSSWKKIFLASISKDKNFSLMINNGLPVIWHSIYKDVDATRDNFINLLRKNFENISLEKLDFPSFQKKNYFTDGDIFLIEISS